MSLTEELATFATGTRPGGIPAELLPWIHNSFTDSTGVAIAARASPVVLAVFRTIRCQGLHRSRLLLLGPQTASAEDAALLNGTAAHVLDYDDAALDAHPGAVLVPALVAAAQARGASGSMMVTAFAVGYETWAELYARSRRPMYERGFHPTGIFGTVAAAAAVSNLWKLDPRIALNALSIAASLASGLTANFGTPMKAVHAGRAAANGLTAVRLACAGVTAAPDVLEQERGLLRAFSADDSADTASAATAGREWRMAQFGLSVKLFPICYGAHRALDAVLSLLEKTPCAPADVDSVIVEIGRSQLLPLCHHRPENAMQAKFSVEFAIAAAILQRRCGIAQLDDAFVRSSQVRSLIERVRIIPLDESDPDEPVFSPFDRVRIVRRDGTTLVSNPVHRPPGHIRRPVSIDRLWQKFDECTSLLEPDERERLFERLQRIEEIHDFSTMPVLDRCVVTVPDDGTHTAILLD